MLFLEDFLPFAVSLQSLQQYFFLREDTNISPHQAQRNSCGFSSRRFRFISPYLHAFEQYFVLPAVVMNFLLHVRQYFIISLG